MTKSCRSIPLRIAPPSVTTERKRSPQFFRVNSFRSFSRRGGEKERAGERSEGRQVVREMEEVGEEERGTHCVILKAANNQETPQLLFIDILHVPL